MDNDFRIAVIMLLGLVAVIIGFEAWRWISRHRELTLIRRMWDVGSRQGG